MVWKGVLESPGAGRPGWFWGAYWQVVKDFMLFCVTICHSSGHQISQRAWLPGSKSKLYLPSLPWIYLFQQYLLSFFGGGPASKDTYTEKQEMVLFLKEPTLRRAEVLWTLRDSIVPCYWRLWTSKMWRKQAVTFSLFLIFCAPGPTFLSHWTWWLYADPGLDNFQILIKNKSSQNKSSQSKSSVWGPQSIPVMMLWDHFYYYSCFLAKETKAQAVKNDPNVKC